MANEFIYGKEVSGFYGLGKVQTQCTVFVYPQRRGGSWYVIEGSENINFTYDDLSDGVNTEAINDIDTIGSDPVESLEQLIQEVDE